MDLCCGSRPTEKALGYVHTTSGEGRTRGKTTTINIYTVLNVQMLNSQAEWSRTAQWRNFQLAVLHHSTQDQEGVHHFTVEPKITIPDLIVHRPDTI